MKCFVDMQNERRKGGVIQTFIVDQGREGKMPLEGE